MVFFISIIIITRFSFKFNNSITKCHNVLKTKYTINVYMHISNSMEKKKIIEISKS